MLTPATVGLTKNFISFYPKSFEKRQSLPLTTHPHSFTTFPAADHHIPFYPPHFVLLLHLYLSRRKIKKEKKGKTFSFLLPNHGKRFLSVAVLHFLHRIPSWRHGSPRFRCRNSRYASPQACHRLLICLRLRLRRLRFRKQHAPILHRRCSGFEDLPYRCPSHESLLHRLRHRSTRFRKALSRKSRSWTVNRDSNPIFFFRSLIGS